MIFLAFFKNTPRSGRNLEKTVLVKKFPRFEDPFCLGKQEKARSLRLNDDDGSLNDGITSQDEVSGRDAVVKSFADPNTPKVNIPNICIIIMYNDMDSQIKSFLPISVGFVSSGLCNTLPRL